MIERKGLWKIVLGESGEKGLTNSAIAAAHKHLARVVEKRDLSKQACAHTEKVIGGFFEALGWKMTIQWRDGVVATRPEDKNQK